MNYLQKYLSTSLLTTAALLGGASPAWAQVSLGAASGFAVLGGTNVTCTHAVVTGDVGVSPGGAVPFTDTGCAFAGGTPPGTNQAAAQAKPAFLSAYAALRSTPNCIHTGGTLAGRELPPGVYCLDPAAKTGTLTLQGRSTGVWIFLANGAVTGTNFHVVMAGGGLACNVFWAPSAGLTMTTSTFKGNILAGNAAAGSITLTGGTLVGRALADVAVTMTGVGVMGCDALSNPTPPPPRDHRGDGHGNGQSTIPFR